MRRIDSFILLLFILVLFPAIGASGMAGAATAQAPPYINEPIQPIPFPAPRTAQENAKIVLGEKLFSDVRLSSNNNSACITCHPLEQGGMDNLRFSTRANGEPTPVNTPTIFNLALNFRLFWNGRTRTLEDQIRTDPLPDNSTQWAEVLVKLSQDEIYLKEFDSLYAEGISANNIQDAIVAFERSLVTPNSRFDKFLRGDKSAISASEKQGYDLFKSYGCAACHQGANVGGNMFQKLGVVANYFADRGHITVPDGGRFNVTKREEDRHVFRVPSLRLVALSEPYLHDGGEKTLEDVIGVMAKYQLGRSIPKEHIDLIIAFLKTLPGEYQGRLLTGDKY